MQRYFDTHCHLYCPHFDDDREGAITRAAGLNVSMLSAGTCAESSRTCVELAGRFPNVYAAVGIHPNDADRLETEWDEIKKLCGTDKVIAIGETGLDYYHDHSDRGQQKKCFQAHIDLAQEKNLPLLLHARDSADDVLTMTEPFMRNGGKAVWHCFIAPKKKIESLLDRALEMGLYLGMTGLVTFDDQIPLHKAVKRIPDKHLLLDTDAPYLSPRPKTGGYNEPANCIRIAERLAEIRGVTLSDIARITTRNACSFLSLALPEEEEAARVAYPIRNSLYIALTNECNNNCSFCARNQGYVVKGHNIKLDHAPSADEVIVAMGDVSQYEEVVFCGFGEPTLRLNVLLEIGRYLKQKNMRVRLNTNGLGNLEYNRDIVPELAGILDQISISLNTTDPDQYQQLCNSRFGSGAHAAVCAFIQRCVQIGIDTTATVVEMPGIDVEAAKRLAESLGAKFRARSFVDAG